MPQVVADGGGSSFAPTPWGVVPPSTGSQAPTQFGNIPRINFTPTLPPPAFPVKPGSSVNPASSHQAFLLLIVELVFVVGLSIFADMSPKYNRISIGILIILWILFLITKNSQVQGILSKAGLKF